MNLAQIEENLQILVKSFTKETFIFDLLSTYGLPKASIARLQKGNLNLSKIDGEISWKKKVFFKPVENADLHNEVTELAKQLKHEQRFAIVTDYKTLLAIDTKTQDKLDIELNELPKHFDFFLPWAGMEKAQHANENPADVKAAGRMAKLFDVIKKDNPDNSPEFIHGMNVFLSRLLFCFFAEDTNIFAEGQFTNAIASHTQTDGSDLNTYLDKLFEVLNTSEKERKDLPAYLQAFPYVNGGLFAKPIPAPRFSRRSRQAIIDGGELQWKEINPDIFGSMFQAVVSVDQRGNLGQHYTSVPNIMKVIEPLFLNELFEEFEKAVQTQHTTSRQKILKVLLHRLSKIKLFDPACGSGNFLIIAYKELRRLEMKILKELGEFAFSNIHLSNFYGIEIDDFAHEIAQLSLWLAEHQMNVEFYNQFGRTNPTLPLREAGHIVKGNACRLDWELVCPKQEGDEIYILGNPPYLGARIQKPEHKSDMKFVFGSTSIEYNNLDYIAPWFFKGANFIRNLPLSKIALVSTNSISQGEQVSILWPYIICDKIEIDFAYKPFLWTNNAKDKAAVYCVIICLRYESKKTKYLFIDTLKKEVLNINGYLIDFKNIYLQKRREPISQLPQMMFGSMANDEGNLIFTEEERIEVINNYPSSEKYFKKLVGAVEFTNNTYRWCLWISDSELEEALKIQPIKIRIEKVKQSRLKSDRTATNVLAEKPHAFAEIRHRAGNSILIPRVTSERREYLQCGFYDDKTVILDRAAVIYGDYPHLFSVLSSKIHTYWTHTVSGRLKMDINYAVGITYNNFPFPPITDKQKEELTLCTFRILEEREKHPEKTLA
ncbi:MAG: N-6 DNA methylase, partial [Bacteroidales bacterium]|nr:N-6 DNA methylase [Bacteroidales bacterium]